MQAKKKCPHPIDRYVGSKLRKRRIELKLSQKQLAYGINLTFQQLQKYEKGLNRISASKLYEISKILRTNVHYFFSDAKEIEDTIENMKDYNTLELSKNIDNLLENLKNLQSLFSIGS